MLPEDDRMIETCRSVLSVLMQILDLKTICVNLLVCYLNKLQNARCNDKDIYHYFFNLEAHPYGIIINM